MRLFRIGDKVVSRERLLEHVDAILAEREAGATQEEAAERHGVQRTFVSFLESLGEVRRGPKVALVGFPVGNNEEVRALAEARAVDFVLVLSQAERETMEGGEAAVVFNLVLDTLAELKEHDVIVLMASDKRIAAIERILGREVVAIPLGASPMRADGTADIAELDAVLAAVTGRSAPSKR